MGKVVIERHATERVFAEESIAIDVKTFHEQFVRGDFAFVLLCGARDACVRCINHMRGRATCRCHATHRGDESIAIDIARRIFIDRTIAVVIDFACVGCARCVRVDRVGACIRVCFGDRVDPHCFQEFRMVALQRVERCEHLLSRREINAIHATDEQHRWLLLGGILFAEHDDFDRSSASRSGDAFDARPRSSFTVG